MYSFNPVLIRVYFSSVGSLKRDKLRGLEQTIELLPLSHRYKAMPSQLLHDQSELKTLLPDPNREMIQVETIEVQDSAVCVESTSCDLGMEMGMATATLHSTEFWDVDEIPSCPTSSLHWDPTPGDSSDCHDTIAVEGHPHPNPRVARNLGVSTAGDDTENQAATTTLEAKWNGDGSNVADDDSDASGGGDGDDCVGGIVSRRFGWAREQNRKRTVDLNHSLRSVFLRNGLPKYQPFMGHSFVPRLAIPSIMKTPSTRRRSSIQLRTGAPPPLSSPPVCSIII